MYVLRFAEIGSEPHPEKSKIRSDLVHVVRSAAPGARVESLGIGRLVVDAGGSELEPVLDRLHGLASWSACTICSLAELDHVALAVARGAISSGERFAVKVRRTGAHDFSSPELAARLGAAIVDAIPGAKVDLTAPERTLLVEIAGDRCVLSTSVHVGRDARREPHERPDGTTRFVVDHMLGTLARQLRTLGFDTAYHRDTADAFLLRVAEDEGRVLLTRDRPLARIAGEKAYFVNATNAEAQLEEVLAAFDLEPDEEALFSRCTVCNTPVVKVAKDAVKERVPPRVFASMDDFAQCPTCDRVYWKGTHYRDVKRRHFDARPR